MHAADPHFPTGLHARTHALTGSHISCNDAHPQMSTRKRDKKKTQQSAAAERMKQLRLLLKIQARLTSKPSGRLRSKQSCVDSCSVRRSTGIVRVVKWVPTADSVVEISCVERGARRAREGVRSTAYPPAHPVDGSQPRGRARRTSLNGENGSACAGLSTHSHAHACVHCPTWPAPQSPSVVLYVVAVRRHGATLTQPAAAVPAALQSHRLVFLSQRFCGCGWVPPSREVCSVCGRGRVWTLGRTCFRVSGRSGLYWVSMWTTTAIGSCCPRVYGRSCCPRRSNVGHRTVAVRRCE